MRKTKLAMLQSVVALILCAAMLVGTTFAWFTDEVTSAVNKIQAGNLDVDLVDAAGNSLEGSSLTFMDVTGNTDILWEPGCTFKTQGFRVANRGSLALEYTMYINGLLGDSKLLEAIDFSVQDADGYTVDIDTFEGQLSPKASSDVFYLVGHMDENAGNEYMNLTLTGIGITVYATQAMEESDAFGPEYDKDAFFPGLDAPILGTVDITTVNDLLTADAVIVADGAKVTIPAGTRVEPGTTTLKLRVKLLEETSSNVQLGVNEVLQPMDVTVEGISEDNQVPLTVELSEIAPVGLNMGSIALHHVHDGTTVTMTRVAADAAFTADNQYRYDPATGDLALHMATFSEVAVVADTENAWEGEFDYSWYDASKTELTIANADQLAAFGAIVGGMNGKTQDSFKGKTVKLIADINLGDKESENNPDIIFYPIGYYNSEGTYERTNTAITSGLRNFEGTFDGNGHTVSNFYQNTWEMKGDHDWYDATLQYYRDGMGLFGRVYKGTVKNLTIENFSSDGEITTTGCVAAYADGATFENIAIFNCNPRVYNIGNGGIVGCVGWYAKDAGLKTTFKNITVDNSNKISALWGSYDVACGGIVGQYYPTSGQSSVNYPVNAGLHFENCHVSAVMDVYNDVCANYQYYAYRYTGMLIGSVRENETIDGHVYPKMDGITAKDCTVHFGDWNDYYYCELVANSLASYTHDHQMSRLEQVASVDVSNKTVTDLAGKTMAIPASGRVNYVVVKAKDANGMWIHGDGHDYAECYHFVNGVQHFHDVADADNPNPTETVNGVAGVLKEDKQLIYREFNNLVTGYGWGVTSKGVGDLAGVTILDREVGNSVVKFEKADTAKDSYMTEKTITIGELFKQAKWDDTKLTILNAAVNVTVSPVGEGSTVSGKFERNTSDWTKSTLTFSGTGAATITITDYYFCTATTINVNITERTAEEKFETKFTGNFLYRVGNASNSPVKLGTMFKAVEGAKIGTVSVTIDKVAGNASGTYTPSTTWTNGTIQFSGTGVVKVTITDNNYCIPTELLLEVVDAKNATTATSATVNNVVLLNNVSGSFSVSGGHTLHGNGFTVTLPQTYQSKFSAGYVGIVTISNGNLDNVIVEGPVYPQMNIYRDQAQDSSDETKANYFYNSILINGGNCTISNSKISGARTAICIRGANNVIIDNSTVSGGAVANIEIAGASSVTLRDLTTVQVDQKDSFEQQKIAHGMGVYVTSSVCKIYIEGELSQRNWVNEDQWDALVGNYSSFFPDFFNDAEYANYQKQIAGVTYVNLAMVFACNWNAENLNTTQQTNKDDYAIKDGIALQGYTGGVYSVAGATPTAEDLKEADYQSVGFDPIIPTFSYDNTINDDVDDESNAADTYCVYDEAAGILKIGVSGDSKTLDLSGVTVTKNGATLAHTTYLNGTQISGNSVTIKAADGAKQTLTFKAASNDAGYDKDGNPIAGSIEYTWNVTVEIAVLSYPAPVWNMGGDYQFDKSNCYYAYYSTSQGYGEAVPIYEGIKVNYYNKSGTLVKLDLSGTKTLPTGSANNNSNAFTYTLADGSTLTMKFSSGWKSGATTHQFTLYNNKVYIYPQSLDNDNYVRAKTTNQDFDVKITYTFTDPNGQSTGAQTMQWYNAKASNGNISTVQWKTFDSDNGKESSICVTPDTLVTLADGTQKRIDEVTYADQLLVWNFYTGEYDIAPASIIMNHGYGNYTVVTLNFDDGTTVNTINGHGFFDASINEYVILSEANAKDYIGHEFVKVTGDDHDTVKLVSYSVKTEYTESWSILTAEHYNCILENMWTITPAEVEGSPDYLMPFEVGADMKYDEAKMQADIEKYGLYTYEDFAQYMTEEQFVALGLANWKVSVGKGYITYEEILYLAKIHLG